MIGHEHTWIRVARGAYRCECGALNGAFNDEALRKVASERRVDGRLELAELLELRRFELEVLRDHLRPRPGTSGVWLKETDAAILFELLDAVRQ